MAFNPLFKNQETADELARRLNLQMPADEVVEFTDAQEVEATRPSDQPVDFNSLLVPSNEPVEVAQSEVKPINQTEVVAQPSVLDQKVDYVKRFQDSMDKQRQDSDNKYEQASEGYGSLRDRANMLRSFKQMIQGGVRVANPNYKADMSVADDLTDQAKTKLSEFYKRNQDTREGEKQAFYNIDNELTIGNKGLDLTNKQELMDPNSKISKFYQIKTLQNQTNFPEESRMSPEQVTGLSAFDLMKLNALRNQELKAAQLELGWANLQDRSQRGWANYGLGTQAEKRKSGQFEYGKQEKEQGQQTKIVDTFNKDEVVKKANEMIASADNVIGLVNSDNPIGHAAIPTFMARAAGEVGALTEADKAPFGGTKALSGRIAQVMSDYQSGKLTPENKKFVLDLTKTMQKNANRNKAKRALTERSKLMTAGQYDAKQINDLIMPELNNIKGEQEKALKWSLENQTDPRAQDFLRKNGF